MVRTSWLSSVAKRESWFLEYCHNLSATAGRVQGPTLRPRQQRQVQVEWTMIPGCLQRRRTFTHLLWNTLPCFRRRRTPLLRLKLTQSPIMRISRSLVPLRDNPLHLYFLHRSLIKGTVCGHNGLVGRNRTQFMGLNKAINIHLLNLGSAHFLNRQPSK